MVNLYLPNNVAVAGVLAARMPSMHGFSAIVGMDVITRGDLAITNCSGATCMTFRVPSIQRIDFVVEERAMRNANVKPKAPCPCGKTNSTGKRLPYKHCCRKADQRTLRRLRMGLGDDWMDGT